MMEVAKPAIKFVDDAETSVVGFKASLVDAVGQEVAHRGYDMWVKMADTPVIQHGKALAEDYRKRGETKSGWKWGLSKLADLQALAERVSTDMMVSGNGARESAQEIRRSIGTSAGHQERVQTMNRLDQDSAKIASQGLV